MITYELVQAGDTYGIKRTTSLAGFFKEETFLHIPQALVEYNGAFGFGPRFVWLSKENIPHPVVWTSDKEAVERLLNRFNFKKAEVLSA